MTQAQHCFDQISGCKISLLRDGAGQPLLLLHGACVAGQWLPFLDALSQSFTVYLPTHPGFGESETPDWLDTIDDLLQKGMLLCGSPETVRQKIEEYQKQIGFGYLLPMMQFATLPDQLTKCNLELFAQKVIRPLRSVAEGSILTSG